MIALTRRWRVTLTPALSPEGCIDTPPPSCIIRAFRGPVGPIQEAA